MSISVEVIDCMHGRPAEGIAVRLESQVGGAWGEPTRGVTDENGLLREWQPSLVVARRIYRIELDIDRYYATLGIVPFLPRVTITFRVLDPAERHHLPISITPYSQSTYQAK